MNERVENKGTLTPALSQGEREEEGVVVPGDYVCARCGYPSGTSGSVICPECGHAATAVEVGARERRREAVRRWEDGAGERFHSLWVVLGLATVVGLGLVSRNAMVSLGMATLLSVVLPPSVWLGGLFLGTRDAERQAYMWCLWHRQVWMLHLPWLVWPGLLAVALFVGLIEKWAGGRGDGAYQTAVFVGFWLCALGCVIAFGVWWQKRLHALAAGGYWRLGWDDGWAFVVGLAVVLVAGFLGFLAGAAVAYGVADWLGLHGFM